MSIHSLLASWFHHACFKKIILDLHDFVLSQLTGANGFAIGTLDFDWYTLTSFLNSPIIVPKWCQINMFIGFVLSVGIVAPIVYYSNLWYTKILPISYLEFFNLNGNLYDINQIIDAQGRFNVTAYEMYNRVYGSPHLSIAAIVAFALSFAIVSSLIVHTGLYHGRDIIKQFRTSLSNRDNDIHCTHRRLSVSVSKFL
ncbi:unnamed protein product [Didymodactylos carnosus]|uniref:Uncharacterized protein n=1 Tax=Didymodactylos carnosus TaxID=1234261 RepID=A0A8S2JAZ4_9BILA|nr:unnamed protein product [Didymodactylos carnosus]CAF3800047.1 unnamed protein product [Didymodactylos carnosus]